MLQILAAGGATLGIVVALRPPTAHLGVSLLTLVALLVYLGAAAFALLAWQVESWRSDPNPRTLWENHGNKSAEWLRHQIILNRIECRETNDVRIERKVVRVKWAQRLLAAEIVYLVAFLIVRPYI